MPRSHKRSASQGTKAANPAVQAKAATPAFINKENVNTINQKSSTSGKSFGAPPKPTVSSTSRGGVLARRQPLSMHQVATLTNSTDYSKGGSRAERIVRDDAENVCFNVILF